MSPNNSHNAARPSLRLEPPPPPTLNAAQFAAVRDQIARYSGVFLDNARQRMLEGCLADRLVATRHPLDTYLALLMAEGGDEIQQLAELVLNHETVFFRNSAHMRALRELVLPALHKRKPPGEPLRLWSAGCATGEEAYSLAITACEALGLPPSRPVQVWGTDLSNAALRRARNGVYRGRTIAQVPPAVRARYFQPQGDGLSVRDSVRSLVRFDQLNLLDPFPPEAQGVDLIFCQNVTIYFQLATCRILMERFHAALPVGGFLFLGFSETLWNIFDGFRSQEMAGTFVYYKEAYGAPKSVLTSRAVRTPLAPTVSTGRQRHGARLAAALTRPNAQPSAEETLARARTLLANGEAEATLEVLRSIAPDARCAPQALALAARAHANRGDIDLAVAEAHRALDLEPLLADAELLVGMLYGKQGQWQMAVQHLERARYLDATSATVSFNLAEAYRHCGRAATAAREYRNALHKLDAHPPDALLDGVAVGWIRETCRRYLQQLAPHTR
jgi:chemotaxis protein methyltransferase CheR